MKTKLFVLVFSLLLFSGISSAAKVGGVSLPQTLTAGEQTLTLNGAGIRKKLFLKLYVGALYLQEKNNSGAAISEVDAFS